MNSHVPHSIGKLLATAFALAGSFGIAHAQNTQAAPASDASASPRVSAKTRSHENERRLALIVKKMSEDSGARIECDSSVASMTVLPPSEGTTAENFEKQIDVLVSHLPRGTTWAKLYMPDSATAKYRPDDLADFAMTEARLFGGVGAALPPGSIEVLGQKLAADKAASVGAALSLKPIYIIANGRPRQPSTTQRAQALLAMDPEQRQAALGDMMRESADVMREMFAGMTPDERNAMMSKGMKFTAVTPNGGQATVIIRDNRDGSPPIPPNP